MLTAHLTQVFDEASVQLTAAGQHVAHYRLTKEDGPGPVPAANAVLAAYGWKVVGDWRGGWRQTSGGLSGGEWTATVEQAGGEA